MNTGNNEPNETVAPAAPGGWEPIPQSEGYDEGATAFVQLPPEFMLDGIPLEAPGHGYTPPMILPLQPLAQPPAEGVEFFAPESEQRPESLPHGYGEDGAGAPVARPYMGHDPHATAEWHFGGTGQWTNPAEGREGFLAEGGQEFPAGGREGFSAEGAQEFPVEGREGFPSEGLQEFSGEAVGAFPAEGLEEFPAEGLQGSPAEGGRAFPADGGREFPADGVREYPAEGVHAFPAEGFQGFPAEAVHEFPADEPGEFRSEGVQDVQGFPGVRDFPGEPGVSEAVSYGQAPATLPGGAPAPWAVPDAAAEPVSEAVPGLGSTPEAGLEAGPVSGAGPEGVSEAGPAAEVGPVPAPEAEPEPELVEGAAPAPALEPESGPEAAPGPVDAPASEGVEAAVAQAAAVVEAAAPVPDAAVPSYTSVDSDEHPHTSYVLRVNGADRPVTDSWIGESLLYVLRERLGLAGAKDGCSQGECGACNVQVDGRLVASCLVPAATAAGSEVRTVEGLAVDGEPSDVQRALSRCGTVQCGFCIPGMCMTVHDLLEGNHAPTPLEARQALAGNLCRCSGYKGVLQAVEDVVAERAASAAEHAPAGEDDASARIPHQHDGGSA
ncbi:2Fe-2S iron-sulfur cluster-binding protein [Streptomyces sp. NPDC007945]|uniref:(2Fe-2S)-binding protein n=1 Tax=Streptomyces sp. NPDC007945 TaxID=3364797 RepID=UPI0036E05567